MRIDGPHRASLPVSNPAGRPRGAAEAAPAFEAPPAATPPATSEPAGGEAPAEDKAHGLVRAGEHSHRSDVAALRQWINHPELRDSLELPDLAAEHKGNGFQKAAAAYEAAVAISTPPPATEAPPVTETEPALLDELLPDSPSAEPGV